MNKNISLLILISLAVIIFSGCSKTVQENNDQANDPVKSNKDEETSNVFVYFFWGDGCPHCAEEKPFLEDLEEKYPELEVKMFEVYRDQGNQELFKEMAQAYGTQARGVPGTFIGDLDPIVGFGSVETTGKQIESMIKTCIEQGCIDPGSRIE